MRTYPEYKDSGVEWIGEIPKEWIEKRFKYLNQVVYSGEWGVEPDGDQTENLVNVIRVTEFDYKKLKIKPRIPTIRSLVLETTSPKLVRYGDLILEKSGGGEKTPVGRLVMVRHDVTTPTINSNFTNLIRTDDRYTDPRFVTYLYHTCYNLGVTRRNIKQTTGIQNLFLYGIFDEKIFIPPLSEQKQISDYLDRKTQQIDDLIEKTEQRIELLKEQRSSLINQCVTKGLDPNVEMKDSGVEWIGEIPRGWEVSKIKYLTNLISKGTTPSTIGEEIEDDGEIRYLKSENIIDQKISLVPEFSISNETDQILKRSRLFVDDVLIVIAGAMIGKTAIVNEEIVPANTNQAVCFIRPKKEFLSKMIWYWFQTGYIETQLKTLSVTSAQPNLSMENIGNFSIVLHGEDSWRDISNHLDHETSKIDQMVDTETKRIDLLKEYRQSLISNVVTGKIDVRDEVIQ